MSCEIKVVCEMVIVLLRMAAHMRTSSTRTHIPIDPTSVLPPVTRGRKRPTDFAILVQTIINYSCTPVQYCTRSSNDFPMVEKTERQLRASVHLRPQSPIRSNAWGYDEGEQGKNDHRKEEKEAEPKIHPR